MMLIGIAMVDH